MNKIFLLGHLGKDPLCVQSDEGNKFYVLSLATHEVWKDDSDKKQQRTTWHRVLVFNEKAFEITQRYLSKGSQVLICGKISYTKYQTDDGRNGTNTEIIVGSKGSLTLVGSSSATEPQETPSTSQEITPINPQPQGE